MFYDLVEFLDLLHEDDVGSCHLIEELIIGFDCIEHPKLALKHVVLKLDGILLNVARLIDHLLLEFIHLHNVLVQEDLELLQGKLVGRFLEK